MEYKCITCNKKYSSYQSLWIHNKKFHGNQNIESNSCVSIDNKLNCCYCNKTFSFLTNKYRHQKTCKNGKIVALNNENQELKKQLVTNNINNGNINNGNINNGKIINNTFVKFDNLDYKKIFSPKQIISILKRQFMSLEESIEKVHFNDDLPAYNNIYITNMKDTLAYVFNGSEFIAVNKNEMLNSLIDTHHNEINISLEKYRKKLSSDIVERLENFLERLNDKTKFKDRQNNKNYSNYKAYKVDAIKLIIYNHSNKNRLAKLKKSKLVELQIDTDSELEI